MTFFYPKSALPEGPTEHEIEQLKQQAEAEFNELLETYRLAIESRDADAAAILQRWQDEKAQPNMKPESASDEDYERPPLPAPAGPMMKIINVLSGRSTDDVGGGQVVTSEPKISNSFAPAQAFHPLGKYSGEVGRWFERRGSFSLLGKFSGERGRWFE